MEGKHPRSGAWLRPEGAGGGRGGGVDLTFSAPKSVSVLWGLGDERSRREIESAHAAAVQQAMDLLCESVATVRRSGGRIEEPAADLIAAEYRHTTARAVRDGEAPDPQLHSHVVVTSAVREDGRIVAVASRPVFRFGYQTSLIRHHKAVPAIPKTPENRCLGVPAVPCHGEGRGFESLHPLRAKAPRCRPKDGRAPAAVARQPARNTTHARIGTMILSRRIMHSARWR
jgi:hypothetical protein